MLHPLLDRLQTEALAAFEAHEWNVFMQMFSLDLSYKQLDGQVIGFEQLANDVRRQLALLTKIKTRQTRTELQVEQHEIRETSICLAWATTKLLGPIQQLWSLRRKSASIWRENEGQWKIVETEVLEEQFSRRGLRFAWHPELPSLDELDHVD